MNFQHIARRVTHKPVIMSTLCALPSITCAYAKTERIAIFTASKETLHPMRQLLWDECGVDPEDKRFVIVGCQDVPGFETVAQGERVDVQECMSHIVKLAQDVVAEHAETDSPIRAIVFECTELPPYSDAVRAATKLPVFDAITLADFVCSSRTDNPRFGATFGDFGSDNPVDRSQGLDKASVPAIGILRIDYDYPPAPGDIDHPGSYPYRTHHEVAKGLTFEAAQAGAPLTAAQP